MISKNFANTNGSTCVLTLQFAGTWHKVGRLNGTGVYDSGHIRFEIDGDDVSILTTGVRYVMTSCKQRVMAINYNVKCHAYHQYTVSQCNE